MENNLINESFDSTYTPEINFTAISWDDTFEITECGPTKEDVEDGEKMSLSFNSEHSIWVY